MRTDLPGQNGRLAGERGPDERDLERAREEVIAHLYARRIMAHDSDSLDDLVRLLEEVESFERIVEKHGGDLMVLEPSRVQRDEEPTDRPFALPRRGDDESAEAFRQKVRRVGQAIDNR